MKLLRHHRFLVITALAGTISMGTIGYANAADTRNQERNPSSNTAVLQDSTTNNTAADNSTNRSTAPGKANTTVGAKIDDAVITTKVRSALLADNGVKSFDPKIETNKGIVQLSGFVDNQAQIDRAIEVARGVEGVQGVENKMTLKSGTATIGNKIDDSIVTTRVKSALLADPATKSFNIGVVTRKGMVQLSGFADSQEQIDRAIDITRGVQGTAGVQNEMSLKK